MTTINLLPWREKKYHTENKIFFSLLISSIIFSSTIIALFTAYRHHLNNMQTLKNNDLQKEIALFDKQIASIRALKKIQQLLSLHIKKIQTFQINNFLILHFFDELIKIFPQTIVLTAIACDANKVTLQGYSASNADITEFIQVLQQASWLKKLTLSLLKRDKKTFKTAFNLNFILTSNYHA